MPPLITLRRLRITVIVVVVVAVALSIAGYFYVNSVVRASFPGYDGTLRLAGMTSTARVYRDGQAIPQVYADDSSDLFLAEGYVEAQDRFWQMDIGRHFAAGRLSELFGASTVPDDEFLRSLGLQQVAAAELAGLDPRTRGYLDAYAQGVNDYLAGRSTSDIALEYSALGVSHPGYSPPRWTDVDSLLWLKAMAWDLNSNLGDEVQRSLLAQTLTPDQIDFLYPSYPYTQAPVIVAQGAVGTNGAYQQDAAPAPALPAPVRSELGKLSQSLAQIPSLLGPSGTGSGAVSSGADADTGVGSNAWVVSGKYTATGKPLLANDPHLGTSLPSLWYQVGLHCTALSAACPFDVSGFALPGVPGVLIGHNSSVAWGMANSEADVTDLYLESVDNAAGTYLFDGVQLPLATRKETIDVSGGSPVTITVRTTRDGPLISDYAGEFQQVGADAEVAAAATTPPRPVGGYAIALRWTALTPGTTMQAVFGLDTATNWAAFRAAAAQFDVPSLDMVYADTSGNIGYQLPGRIPIRAAGDGRWPEPGWTAQYEWTGYIPFAALPTELNPAAGYIVAANNAVVGPTYPYELTADWDYGYRAQRITTLLTQRINAGAKLTPADMSAIQGDTLNPMAAQLVPLLLAQPVDAFTAQAQSLLRGWDGTQPPGSAAAAYFNAVWADLLKMSFWNKLPADARPDGGSRWMAVVSAMLADPENTWWDDPRTPLRETRDGVLVAAMRQARLDLTAKSGKDPTLWTWGSVHTVPMRDQTLGIDAPGTASWLLNADPVQVGGGNAAVDATSWDASQGFGVTVAPSMRMVVDLGGFDDSRWIISTGESGHASHPNATDQAGLWAGGQALPWISDPARIAAAARHTLVLQPPAPPGAPTPGPASATPPVSVTPAGAKPPGGATAAPGAGATRPAHPPVTSARAPTASPRR